MLSHPTELFLGHVFAKLLINTLIFNELYINLGRGVCHFKLMI